MTADSQTEQYAAAMDEAITAATRAEDERDVAQAEVASLKRKFEPDTGILLNKMLTLADRDGTNYMRVTVHTGERLVLDLIPRIRNNGDLPNWTFAPAVEGTPDNKQTFDDYGTYEVNIGDGSNSHDLLVTFSKPATVNVTVVTDHDGSFMGGPDTIDTMTIQELTTPAAVLLAMGDDS